MKDFRFLLFFLFLFEISHSQIDSLMAKEAKGPALRRLGKNALIQNDPNAAITFFNAYLLTAKQDAEATAMLGTAYMKVRDYEKAQRTFLRAYNINERKAGEALYYHAQMMKSNGQYDSAKINFQRFKKEYRGNQKHLRKRSSLEIQFCDSVKRLNQLNKKIIVTVLDTTINKINVEAAPANYSDNELVFTSLRTNESEYEVEDEPSIALKRKLYLAKRQGNKWRYAGEFGTVFNESGMHTGNASFSVDRKRIYFTRCKLNYRDEMICAIYVSSKEGDEWSEPKRLPKIINDKKYTSTMPALTVDPLKGNDVIYFVSNRKGGKGGLDIWYSSYNPKKDEYKKPRNAGPMLNTSENEISPFFDSETRTLYFSSSGWTSFGGYDVFKTTGDGKKFSGIENLGKPINSGADDIFYSISTNREEGFFVSNRKGGNSAKNKTCCDDIYFYKYSEFIRLVLKGTITDALDYGAAIPFANIALFIRDKVTKEKFLVKTIKADSLGRYKTAVEPGRDYYIVAKKDDFLGTNVELSTQGITASQSLKRDMQMIRKPKNAIHIPNIKYEFDRSNILEESKIALDTTVLRLMENNPEIIVEIMSHTDSKGSDSYNLKLSQKRAESAVKYLMGKGIAQNRLKAKGYGESQPIAPNELSNGSDNPEGRALNRRTDFKIIGTIDSEIIIDPY